MSLMGGMGKGETNVASHEATNADEVEGEVEGIMERGLGQLQGPDLHSPIGPTL